MSRVIGGFMERPLLKTLFVFLLNFASSVALPQNAATLLDDGRRALDARLELILHAKDPFLSVFDINEDTVGMSQLAALVQSSHNGEHPRLLIDGIGKRISCRTIRHLRREGVEVRIFHPLYPTPIFQNGTSQALQRMHDKILTSADGVIVTGGRNSADKFYGHDPQLKNYIDFEVIIRGPLANDARAYQDALWNSALTVEPYCGANHSNDGSVTEEKFAAARHDLEKEGWFDLHKNLASGTWSRAWLANLVPVTGEFLHDSVDSRVNKAEGTYRGFLELVRAAKTRILIDADYLLLDDEELAALRAAVQRGVEIHVVTNGKTATGSMTDHLTQDAFELAKPKIRSIGISVSEFAGPGRLHSKSIAADGTDCLIWSFNLDPRSRHTNFEAGVRLKSPVICGQLMERIQTHVDDSLLSIDHGRQMILDRSIGYAHRGLIDVLRKEL